MALIIDNFFYIINTVSMNVRFRNRKNGKKGNKKLIIDNNAGFGRTVGVEDGGVTVLMPAKHENLGTMSETIGSIKMQTKRPEKILILVNNDDINTISEASKIDGVEIFGMECHSKAEALNKAISGVGTDFVFIIDVGDLLKDENYLAKMVSEVENADACVPIQVPKNGHKFAREMMNYEFMMWNRNLKNIWNNYGICPLPGTGLLLRTDFVNRVHFPETLAEDAAIGFYVKDVAFSKSSLMYDIPVRLWDHLKQRARWYAGYMQNWKYASTLYGKWLCMTPILGGLVSISLIMTPITYFLGFGLGFGDSGLLSETAKIVDILAGINLAAYVGYLGIKFRSAKLLLMTPVWWFVTGLSFYISLYYFWTGKWYTSPKSVTVKRNLGLDLRLGSLVDTAEDIVKEMDKIEKSLVLASY